MDNGMKDTIKLLDVVALAVDLPEHNLWRGQVGTAVEILAHGDAFEVEFSDSDGRSYASLGLRPDQIDGIALRTIASARASASLLKEDQYAGKCSGCISAW
jgi:hypothetical protein